MKSLNGVDVEFEVSMCIMFGMFVSQCLYDFN